MEAAKTSPIGVLIARFEDLIARGLRAIVEEHSSVQLVAADVRHAQLHSSLQRHRVDVAILDLRALRNPAEVRELRSRHPGTHLVLLADHPSAAECAQMLAFGASACLSKATQARDVLNATHLASRGLQLVPHVEGQSSDGAALAFESLTRREADVLHLLRQALPNGEIAASLQVSVETVRTHARNIYRKLGVSSRRELFAPAPLLGASGPPEVADRAGREPDRDRLASPASAG